MGAARMNVSRLILFGMVISVMVTCTSASGSVTLSWEAVSIPECAEWKLCRFYATRGSLDDPRVL